MMESRRLGGTDVEVSRLILGCGNFGGIGSAPEFFGQGETEDDAFRIMDAAWELGIRAFDTADAYGGGRSERAIGRWMAARGVRPRLTTKTFNPMEAGADHGLKPDRVARQLRSSLDRLGVGQVELYLAHEYDPDVPLAETLGAFGTAQADGLIGAYGVSNFDAPQLAAALAAGAPRAVQNSYSLLARQDEPDLLPLCAQRGVAYLAFGPLAGGWLTGQTGRGTARWSRHGEALTYEGGAAFGWAVHEHVVPGDWPRPEAAACALLTEVLAGQHLRSVASLLDPDDYGPSQALGRRLRRRRDVAVLVPE